jgi:RHS repeat-associated protein
MDASVMNSNTWQASYAQDNRYKENFSYDWNGNIITVDRYDGTTSSAVKIDALNYNYAANSNLLDHIDDAVSGGVPCAYNDDLDDQSSTNYNYDPLGALNQDVSERIDNITWNPYGKMKGVFKDQTNNTNACTSTEYADADVEYLYTASQQRLCKIVKPHLLSGAGITDQDRWTYYWYAYDAGGQLMAVYKQTYEDLTAGNWKVHLDVQEQDVYGSGRLGIRKGDDDGKYYRQFAGTKSGGVFNSLLYSGSSAALSRDHYSRELGSKQYEVANHLGNVLVTVSDKRLGYMATPVSLGTVDWYTADVLSYSDYYVFGAAQPGRTGGDSYRYGFNGKENDPEVEAGAIQDYGMRMYDPRVGRFFSADPLMFDYPYYTPYQFAGNKPITYIDLDGCEEAPPCAEEGKGKVFGETCTDNNGDVLTWTQYPNTDPANNQGAWLRSGDVVVSASTSNAKRDGWLPGVTIVGASGKTEEEKAQYSRDELEAGVLDYVGWLVNVPKRNVDLSAITYSVREYDNDEYGNVFLSNIIGGVYNQLVVGNIDLALNPKSALGDMWNAANQKAAHQAACIYTGTVCGDLKEEISNPHNWENSLATVAIILGGRVFPSGVAAEEGILGKGKYLEDFPTKNTKNYSSYYSSERSARNLARQKLGKNPLKVGPNKWRSANGKWQYRAKPGDVSKNHIHLEELNPKTGAVKANYHLRW